MGWVESIFSLRPIASKQSKKTNQHRRIAVAIKKLSEGFLSGLAVGNFHVALTIHELLWSSGSVDGASTQAAAYWFRFLNELDQVRHRMHSLFEKTDSSLGLAVLLGGLAFCLPANAQQSGLPVCAQDQRNEWHNCYGTRKYFDGWVYTGEFRNNLRGGNGVELYPNGNQYVGEFRDDKRHGLGTIYGQKSLHGQAYDIIARGQWAEGKFVKEVNIRPPAQRTPPMVASPSPPAAAKYSSGSAFRIAAGRFVTNHHVVDSCSTLKVDGKPGGRVVASDPTRDLALVSLINDRGDIASIRTTKIQLNEGITTAGFPMDGAFSGIAVTNGTISRLSGLRGDTGEVQISAPVQPGNSGGPLLDTAGNVIGVISSKLNALKVAGINGDIPQNVNFAINGSTLRVFLDAKGFNYKEVGNESELTGVQVAARASGFTVLIECQR